MILISPRFLLLVVLLDMALAFYIGYTIGIKLN